MTTVAQPQRPAVQLSRLSGDTRHRSLATPAVPFVLPMPGLSRLLPTALQVLAALHADAIRASTEWNGLHREAFILIGLPFLVSCFGMSRHSMYQERKLRTDHP